MRALNLISFSKPVAFQAAAPFAGRQNLRWAVQTCQAKLALPDDARERVIQVGIDVAGPGEDETVMVARVG
jgi:hypothetical protein